MLHSRQCSLLMVTKGRLKQSLYLSAYSQLYGDIVNEIMNFKPFEFTILKQI